MTGSFLEEPPPSPQAQALYDEDLADAGYVQNVSRLWAHQPDTVNQLFGLMSAALAPSGLGFRQRGVLVTATVSALGDSCCSLAWGGKLSSASSAEVAAAVLSGSDAGLTDQDKAMARWARKGRPRPERHDSRRHPGPPRLWARSRADLRDHRLHRPAPRVLRHQRLARRPARRRSRSFAAPAGARRRDLRPAATSRR
jgi:hypothetical protein